MSRRVFRRDLLDLLYDGPLSVPQIAEHLAASPRDVVDDIDHLAKSVKHMDCRLTVEPARCRKCGFTFGREKLRKPGKCPKCKGTWITEPRFTIEPAARH